MKFKVNVPVVALTSTSIYVEVPDDFDIATGKSQLEPKFDLIDLILECAENVIDKVYDESPSWEVNELELDTYRNGVNPISDLID